MEDVDVAVRNLEIKSLSHFSVYQKDKSFGVADINLKNHKILFEDIKNKESPQQILWSGTPFVIVGKKSLDCTHGVDHGILKKKKIQDEKIKGKVCFTFALKSEKEKERKNNNLFLIYRILKHIARYTVRLGLWFKIRKNLVVQQKS
ncbi:uncharacterized protein LOC130625411 [Hydractinia symbiolongicarpus]|uniref:uncharacterized protein LOC130625411 n=1 Tax=Hydractinia symbiolongicarpus TaxID=13093 RepID=UPI002550C996|nr:uncharacterized protein LOC130625411 [Hydractinia symbiolongicarpus]